MSTGYIYNYWLHAKKEHLEITISKGESDVFTWDGKRAIQEVTLTIKWGDVPDILNVMRDEIKSGVTKFRSFKQFEKDILGLIK